jgi:sulfide:quinone oxidoreductase
MAAAQQRGGGRPQVLIAGGGPAAVEILLGLRELTKDRVKLELLSPRTDLVYRPLAVAEPFGLGESRRYDLLTIAADQGASLHSGALASVDASARVARLADGGEMGYDVLAVAVGAVPRTPIPGAITILGPDYTARFRTLRREVDTRSVTQVAFVVPGGVAWPLPLYELALMTAASVRPDRRPKVELSLVTHEDEPLAIFGHEASATVRSLLEAHGIAVHTSCYPASLEEGELMVTPVSHGRIPAERVVTLPVLDGPHIPGLPFDDDGFIPVDLHGKVQGETDVYAAGDVTSFPVKQGGIATQQADAVAEAIAARVGAAVEPKPFRPVLRGLLLTGDTPRYMRAEIGGGRGEDWEVSEHALWWPPSKIAGRYLSPYLGLQPGELDRGAVPVEVALEERGPSGARRLAFVAPGEDSPLIPVSDSR